MIKNILLDLDGTLTDPKVGITTSARYGLDKIGYPVDDSTNLDWIIGPPLKASLAKILNVDLSDDLAEQALLGYRERFSAIGLYENEVYPTVVETLEKLKEKKYQLFLATAKPTIYAKQILEHFNLAHYFNEIYGSELSGERTNKGDLITYILEQIVFASYPKAHYDFGHRKILNALLPFLIHLQLSLLLHFLDD